ncbi:MAG: beta-lactamase family protein [Cyanobacteria bacterium]|nr:beta-lactamase family protein [Cyanobacteriota bacterium]
MKRTLLIAAFVVLVQPIAPAQQQDVVVDPAPMVDRIFSKWTTATPGCAVGVSAGPRPVLFRAYGMADLEHDVRNTPDTIFEAGSVSKQFTAMAVQLLASEGKLSLDDPVSKYIPELPDYGKPLTIRHMLSHTSGLRDWGSVASIAGWPRTTREYTHAHVLDIVSRQKSLNFDPGTNWSYSNTGFNLAAVIVARVSGMSFAEFSKQRIFQPLGMTRTSWRDDHTRIVKGRAIAYTETNGEYRIEMPFENVHGNGGLLTTVRDLLTWNTNLVSPKVGNAKLIGEMTTVGQFNDGRPLEYGLGFFINDYRGLRNVYHSGSTAGYRAHVNRFPGAMISVAVLCNGSNGDATRTANRVSDVFLGPRLKPAPPAAPAATPPAPLNPPPSADQLNALSGNYWSEEAETVLTAAVDQGALVLKRRPDTVIKMTAIGPDKFRGSIGTVTFMRNASGAISGLSINQDRVWDLRFEKK